jgi:hypothetical protein
MPIFTRHEPFNHHTTFHYKIFQRDDRSAQSQATTVVKSVFVLRNFCRLNSSICNERTCEGIAENVLLCSPPKYPPPVISKLNASSLFQCLIYLQRSTSSELLSVIPPPCTPMYSLMLQVILVKGMSLVKFHVSCAMVENCLLNLQNKKKIQIASISYYYPCFDLMMCYIYIVHGI